MEKQKRQREEDEFDFLNFEIPVENASVMPVLNVPTFSISDQMAFTIIVGGKSFCLSWGSLRSDGPRNFFVDFFLKEKNAKTLHIDRDPKIFELIAKHLRGYYVDPDNSVDSLNLLRDAQFYSLNKLKALLQEYLFLNVGGRIFRLQWSLFTKDDKKNLFNGPLRHTVISEQNKGNSLPLYIDRDPDTFQDIIHLLRGYTIDIRSSVHRENLLKDSQYYAFRKLTDKLLTAKKTATFSDVPSTEITLMLNDVRVLNIKPPEIVDLTIQENNCWESSQLRYEKDSFVYKLLVQVNDLCIRWEKRETENKTPFEMGDKKKLSYIAQTLKASVNPNICFDRDCAVTVDNGDFKKYQEVFNGNIKRLIVEKAICGVHLVDNMVTLYALKIEAVGSKFKLNSNRQFLLSTQ
ncbi:hypothetical protein BY458DRAFT_588830 [Sporodiniella umbellata]|nr:hypothetical protein BY458DRAFT_588830 [Sporodiniella umbellata]